MICKNCRYFEIKKINEDCTKISGTCGYNRGSIKAVRYVQHKSTCNNFDPLSFDIKEYRSMNITLEKFLEFAKDDADKRSIIYGIDGIRYFISDRWIKENPEDWNKIKDKKVVYFHQSNIGLKIRVQ